MGSGYKISKAASIDILLASLPPKGSVTFLHSTTREGPGVQTHKAMENRLVSNYNKEEMR